VTLALAGHALLLAGLPGWDPGEGEPRPAREPGAAVVLVVRTLAPAAEPAEAMSAAEPATQSAAQPAALRPRASAATPLHESAPARDRRDAAERQDTPAQVAVAPPAPSAAAVVPPPGSVAAVDAARDAAEDAPGAAVPEAYAGAPPPVWSTRLPGDFAARYLLQRGDEPARAVTLRFETGEGRYALHLSGAAGGRGPEQASQGRLEATGLAPERYLDRRRARAAAAANFDRTRSRITYSGAPLEQPLYAGAQDRLSWIVQLAAIVDADPSRWHERARLPLYVTGARADAQLWLFTVRGRVWLEGPGGAQQELLHLVREPERPYDVRVEAWLDPAQHHLPARLQLTAVPAGLPLRWSRMP
jgi:hypothetical protein